MRGSPARAGSLAPTARHPRGWSVSRIVLAARSLRLYDYGRSCIAPPDEWKAAAPVFPCSANDLTPLPSVVPKIGWRAGLDLNPLSITSVPDMDWLEALVWPEQSARRERLRAAIQIGRSEPPRVITGNLLTDLEAAMKLAPPRMTP